jgi:WD40 repeat protein/serine/threonine protein kinase
VWDREDLCGRMVGEFVLRERIDEGGFGAVYRCEQPLLGRQAVVKVLHQRLRRNDVVLQRFMREAQLASRLDHPYAAHVYAFGIEHDDGLFWIAMEMVQGIALNRWLRDRGPLPLEQFVPFFERVAEVVQTAHERGIVHRDLKPSNVMVIERAGRLLPKLLDFGIAKLLDEAALPQAGSQRPSGSIESPHVPAPEASPRLLNPSEVSTLTGTTAPPAKNGLQQRLTHADATVGSPPYMSPEQWSNAVTVGTGSDLYALGVVAYEALTGRRPFVAQTLSEYVDLHCFAEVPPLGNGFSPALDRLFQRALAKRPEDRWGSALELAAALRVASGLGSGAADLPKLDETTRDAWLADAPQPLAESIAALDGARNAHQARDTAQELVRNLLSYLLALALATHAQVREDRSDPALLELVRTMRRRDLVDQERVRLLRLLVRPLTSRRRAHPIPELVDLVTPRAEDGTDGLDPILSLYTTGDHSGTEDIVRSRLARLVPELTQLLRKTAFVLDYVLIVPRDEAAERWTGLRRQRRAVATLHAGELVKDHPMLLDRDGKICVDLWPVVQAVAPTEGAEPELFLFDGRGRHGARLVAAPAGFEHHDASVWEWVAVRVIADLEVNAEVSNDDHPPYLGLTSFSVNDSDRFVGRELEVEGFLNRLRQRPLQVVVGPSGAGKSSFVHAGVIPGLPQGWRIVTVRPGGAPIAALASRLSAANITTADLRPVLEGSPAAAAALVAHAAASGTIVVVIDQLEELFTLCTNPAERVQFAAVIAQLAASADAPIRVICAIRDDFLMQLETLAPLRPLLSPALVLLGNPSRDALVRIVDEPARRAGYALSDTELANDMVNVVVDRPGALALLSFTASRLWELRDRRFRQLTRNAYDAMGGVGGALGRHAEATLDTMSPNEQGFVREVFRHLVTADGTRAVITSKELHQRLATPRADAVIDKLVAARLITVSESESESHVEVIHEALISAWPRLQRWVREDVDGSRMREQIRTAARQWHDRARPHGLLWHDDVLADLERWLRLPNALALSEVETAFVEASRRDARRAARIRRGLGGAAFTVVVAFAVFQYFTLQNRVAQRLLEARVTQSYSDQGRHALLEGKHAEALLYLAEAAHRGDDSPMMKFMLDRAAQPLLAERGRLKATSGRMWSAVYSRDGQWIVTTDDKGASVWDAKTNERRFSLRHSDVVYRASFSRDGTKVITASVDGSVKIWDLPTGTLVRSLTHPRTDKLVATYFMAEMSPDGKVVAALDTYGKSVDVWDANTGDLVVELTNPDPDGWPSLAFSQGGEWLATSGGGDVRVFDAHTWAKVPVATIPGVQVYNFSFDPTGPRLAVATLAGDASIWEVPTGVRILHLHEIGEPVRHIAFSPDGAFVVTASDDGTARVWKTDTRIPTLQSKFKNHGGSMKWAEFDPTSKLVVSASGEGVAISDAVTGMPVSVLEGPRGTVLSAHFDPSSRRVLGASFDGTARVWDATSPYHQWSSLPIGSDCSPDGSLDEDQRFIAISCTEHGSHVWDTAHDEQIADLPSVTRPPGEFSAAFPAVSAAGDRAAIARGTRVEIYELPGDRSLRPINHPAEISAVAFAKTGHDLVSASVDGTVLITRDDRDPFPLPPYPGGIDAVGFTPDGRVLVASAGGRLRVYDPERKLVLADLDLPPHTRVRAFRVSADSQRLLTIGTSGSSAPPVLWDLQRYRAVKALDEQQGQVFQARFLRGDHEILTAGADGAARVWDGATGQARQTYLGTGKPLYDATTDAAGTFVMTAGDDGVVRFLDAASGRMIWTLNAHKPGVAGIHLEGADVVTRSLSGEVSRWRLPKLSSPEDFPRMVERFIGCLPQRFNEKTGELVDQPTTCDISAEKP